MTFCDHTEVSTTPTVPVLRLSRLGTRRLTRAHLALSQRQALRLELATALGPMAAAVGEQLDCAVGLQARLLDAALTPKLSLPRVAGYAGFELGSEGAFCALELELPYLVAALARMSGGPARLAAATTFTRIEEAAFGFLALVALHAARRAAPLYDALAPRLCGVWAERSALLERLDVRAPHLVVELRLDIGGDVGTGRLIVPAAAVQGLLQAHPVDPAPPLAGCLAQARVALRTFAGMSRLSRADLSSLHPGDVVMFDALLLRQGAVEGSARLACNAFELHGALGPEGLTVTRVHPRAFPQEHPMQAHEAVEAPSPLPVEVEVELTRIRLSIAELASLRPGALVPLRMGAADPVLLRVGDRAVARAELVEIDGEVGARILALLP